MASVTTRPPDPDLARLAAETLPRAPSTVRIEPPRGWLELHLHEVWQYRELLYFFVWRDVKVRYRQTAIGVLWVVLQPILAMGIFTIFFGRLAKLPSEGLPYLVFYFAALVPWLFFQFAWHLYQCRGEQPAGYYQGLLSSTGAPVSGRVLSAHRLLHWTCCDDCDHFVVRDPFAVEEETEIIEVRRLSDVARELNLRDPCCSSLTYRVSKIK
jgi:hypothetical protein